MIEFRPIFITDQTGVCVQPATRRKRRSQRLSCTSNNNGVDSIQVIFFNRECPSAAANGNGTSIYVGTGPKIPLLVN